MTLFVRVCAHIAMKIIVIRYIDVCARTTKHYVNDTLCRYENNKPEETKKRNYVKRTQLSMREDTARAYIVCTAVYARDN